MTSQQKSASKDSKSGKSGMSDKRAADLQTQTQKQTLSIIVYRGDPVDAPTTRHTALFVEFENGDNVLSYVVSGHGFFQHEESWNIDQPSNSRHFEQSIWVATFETTEDEAMYIRNELRNTPINNEESSWNCHTWVGDALERLRDAELLSQEWFIAVVGQMVGVVFEAPDED
jgi:hypothetical protein